MRIGIFSDTYLPQINGIVTSITTFAEAFEKLGHEVFIFAPKMSGSEKGSRKNILFNSFYFPFQADFRFSIPFSLRLFNFKRFKLDIIHVQTPFSLGYLGRYLARKHNIPLVYTYHMYFTEYSHYVPIIPRGLIKPYAIKESRHFCNQCQLVVVPSHQMRDKLVEYGITSPMEIVPSGISPRDLIAAFNTEIFRKRHGISHEDRLAKANLFYPAFQQSKNPL